MSAQPVHHVPEPRVPASLDGIAQALPSAADRMAFYREVGPLADSTEREAVITTWWTKAMSAAYGRDRAGFRRAVAGHLAETRQSLAGDAGV